MVSEKTDGKAWVGKIIAGDKSTDRAIYFHESSDGVLAGLVRIEFKSIGKTRINEAEISLLSINEHTLLTERSRSLV